MLKRKIDKSDHRILKSFLGRSENEEISETFIKRFDPDKFKPLNNFLKKGLNTDQKNIELLAWLIDCHPRPYSKYQFTEINSEIITNLEITAPQGKSKEITLEYPSGVKLYVDASDFSLIAQLVRI